MRSIARTVACVGDSIVVGGTGSIGVLGGRVGRPWPLKASQLLGPRYASSNRLAAGLNGSDVDQGGLINLGVGGQKLTEIVIGTALAFRPNIVVCAGGTNDFLMTSSTPEATAITVAAMQAAAEAIHAAVTATGAVSVFGTVLKCNSFPSPDARDAGRVTYNAWLMGGALSGAVICDGASVTEMSDPTNTTYFYDGIHPKQAGYDPLGVAYAAAIAIAARSIPS